jgi:ferredoxin-type protein NapH
VAVPAAVQPGVSSPPNPGGLARLPQHGTMAWASYSRYAVLAGALASSLLFGFPVFCLVCPVGLFFGTVFAVSRLFISQQPSLELLLFPALLGVELLVLKSWCHSICPLGALLSMVSRLNLFVRPAVKREVCLTSQGINCRACLRVCPEGIHLPDATDGLAPYDCTKCLECYERCPTKAIRVDLLGKLPGVARAIKRTRFKKVE